MKTIVCGAGQVGQQITRRLKREGVDVTVIDSNPQLVMEVAASLDVTGVTGFASYPSVLEQAGSQDANMIIAATRFDEVNMMICQVAYSHFLVPQKIARIRSRDYLKPRWRTMFRSEHMPVDELMYPERDVADTIVRWLAAPATLGSVSFLDDAVRLVFVRLGEDCPVLEVPLGKISQQFEGLEAIIVAVQREGDIRIAHRDLELAGGDEVHFVVPTDQIKRTLRVFGLDSEAARQIIVVGGGAIGVSIAVSGHELLQKPRIRLIERDKERARKIAQEVSAGAILHGDALDPQLLDEARVSDADAVVAVTDDERTNVLVAACAKEAGTKRALALSKATQMHDIARKLGVDVVIDPEIVTLSSLLGHIRRGFVHAIHASRNGDCDVVEVKVQTTSTVIGKTVREIIPNVCRVGAVMGADGVLKKISGNLRFEVGDRVVLFVHTPDQRVIEGLFQVDIGYF